MTKEIEVTEIETEMTEIVIEVTEIETEVTEGTVIVTGMFPLVSKPDALEMTETRNAPLPDPLLLLPKSQKLI